jgi:hypothetical protein
MLVTKDLPRGQWTYTIVVTPLLVAAMTVGLLVLRYDFPYEIAVLAIMLFIPLSISRIVKVRAGTVAPAHRRVEIASPLAPEAAFAKLAGAKFGRLSLRDRDARRRVLVLETPISGWSWGFTIAVFVRDAGIGSTVDVGIMPKMIQHVATVDDWHKRAVAEIERALAA